MLNAVGDAVAKLRGQLGESLPSVQRFDVPLEQATTASLEALQAYTTGRKIARTKGAVAALAYNQRPFNWIRTSPRRTAQWQRTMGIWRNWSARAITLAKLTSCASTPSERERLLLTADYYDIVTGELDKAAQVYQQMIDNFPRYATGYANLSDVRSAQGLYEDALKLVYLKYGIEKERWFDIAGFAIVPEEF